MSGPQTIAKLYRLFLQSFCVRNLQVVLFDVQQRHAIAELSTPYVKYVVWNADMTQVQLFATFN